MNGANRTLMETRNRCSPFALVIGLIGLGAPVSAQQAIPELLLDVDEPTIARLMSPSNYEFRAQRYFAKRYRIVRINFEVFGKAVNEFTVSPFEGLQMTLVHAPERYSSALGGLQQWNGDLKSPELQLIDGSSQSTLPSSVRIPVTFWVRTGDHEVPLALVRELAMERGDTETISALDESRASEDSLAGPRGFGKLPLRTISGHWFVPSLLTNMVIRPIDGDPRFHIIYEEDPSRIARILDTPNPGGTRVLKERKEFLRKLEEEKARALTEKR